MYDHLTQVKGQHVKEKTMKLDMTEIWNCQGSDKASPGTSVWAQKIHRQQVVLKCGQAGAGMYVHTSKQVWSDE